MAAIALFPGSFDPYTLGHHDIVMRSIELFDKVIVAVGINSNKKRHYPLDVLLPKIKEVYAQEARIEVVQYEGLTAEFARSCGARFIIRGLRNTTDFEYENNIAQANKFLWQDLETVFLITTPGLSYISSTIVREIHKHGKNIDNFLPYRLE